MVVGIALQKVGQPLLFTVTLILRVVKAEVVVTFSHFETTVKAANDLRSKPEATPGYLNFNWASTWTLHQREHRQIAEDFRIEAKIVAARNSGSEE